MVAFLIAGFETTNSTFNFCCYMMAKHPDELKKLQDEVDANFKETSVSNLKCVLSGSFEVHL